MSGPAATHAWPRSAAGGRRAPPNPRQSEGSLARRASPGPHAIDEAPGHYTALRRLWGIQEGSPHGRASVTAYEQGDVRIRYEEAGSGFPLLLIPGGGLNSTIAFFHGHAPFNALEAFKDEYRRPLRRAVRRSRQAHILGVSHVRTGAADRALAAGPWPSEPAPSCPDRP